MTLWTCDTRNRQLTRLALAVSLSVAWMALVIEDLAAQRDEVVMEQLSSLRERLGRDESILFPTAAAVQEIRVQIASITESIQAGKYLAGLLVASSVGHLMLAVYADTPAGRRRRRERDDDSGPIERPDRDRGERT